MLLFQSPSWKSGKSRKIKSEFLLFASLSEEKVSEIVCQDLEKQKKKKQEQNFDVCQAKCRKRKLGRPSHY